MPRPLPPRALMPHPLPPGALMPHPLMPRLLTPHPLTRRPLTPHPLTRRPLTRRLRRSKPPLPTPEPGPVADPVVARPAMVESAPAQIGRRAEPGPDGRLRCPWALGSAEYLDYHDDEWGRPVRDDQGMFERLCLEAFQSGLSWLTILRKRENFRAAFRGFDIAAVAAFAPADVARLLGDAGIVRNRAKIEAVIRNARAAQALPGGLAALVWQYADAPAGPGQGVGAKGQSAKGQGAKDQGAKDQGAKDQGAKGQGAKDQGGPASTADIPSWTPASKALSRELRRRGFSFTGPVTAYATLQACGVVDDHLLGCFRRGAYS
jgi:DNA-3-methyladenine glycosylase I